MRFVERWAFVSLFMCPMCILLTLTSRYCTLQDMPVTYRFAVTVADVETFLTGDARVASTLPGMFLSAGVNLVSGYIFDGLGSFTKYSFGVDRRSNVTIVVANPVVADPVAYLNAKTSSLVDDALKQNKVSQVLNNIAVFSSLLKSSSDPCTAVDCSGHGTCALGACACDVGYQSASNGTECEPLPPVNGTYSEWSPFGSCSSSCGGGTLRFTRKYTPALYGGVDFFEATTKSEACNPQPCTVVSDGGYSDWAEWSDCSNSCPGDRGGFFNGTRTRTRFCNNPIPSSGGRDCSSLGDSSETGASFCWLVSLFRCRFDPSARVRCCFHSRALHSRLQHRLVLAMGKALSRQQLGEA